MPKYKKVRSDKRTNKGYEVVTWLDGTRDYFLDGRYHRIDGHAYEGIRNNKQWWLNGKQLDKDWFLENPDKINEMKAWELFEPEELVRLKL